MPGQVSPQGNAVEESDRGRGRGRDTGLFDTQGGSFDGLEFAQAQDTVIDEPAFHYIDQLVCCCPVGGEHEESWVNQIADGVITIPSINSSVAELKPHPDSMNNGGAGVEVEMIANRVPSKLLT